MPRPATTVDSIFAVALVSAIATACGGNVDVYETSGDGDVSGAPCNIQAARYDVSCSVDSDCTTFAVHYPVQFGNFCQARSMCLCAVNAINRSSANQYASDVANTPLEQNPADCNCPGETTPCCNANVCTVGGACGPFRPDAGGD